MTTKLDQMRLKLEIASPLPLPEVKVLLKDIYRQLDEMQNEIRKISENRPRPNIGSGKSL
jgi:hypothetical protein